MKTIKLWLSKKPILIATIGVAVVLAGGLSWLLLHKSEPQSPQYKTVIPSSRPVEDLGGWKRVSPPDQKPVFAYSDKINSVPISVSQQPLPESFRANPQEEVKDLAKKFNATTEVLTDDTTIYIGTSAKGPQSVIFSKDSLLIMIKSERKIDNESWATYVQSLE